MFYKGSFTVATPPLLQAAANLVGNKMNLFGCSEKNKINNTETPTKITRMPGSSSSETEKLVWSQAGEPQELDGHLQVKLP